MMYVTCDSFRMCDMTHSDVWHDSFTCVTWLIQMCDITHFKCVTWLISSVWHDSFRCVTRLIYMRDMTHSDVWRDSFHICDMTHSYVWRVSFKHDTTHSHEWHDTFICVTCRIRICVMTYSNVRHDSFHIYDMTRFIFVTWLIRVCAMARSLVWHDSFILVTWIFLYVWRVPHIHPFDLAHAFMYSFFYVSIVYLFSYFPFFLTLW